MTDNLWQDIVDAIDDTYRNGRSFDAAKAADAVVNVVQPELYKLRKADLLADSHRRAEQAEAELEQLRGVLNEVLEAFEMYWAHASYDGPAENCVRPEQFTAWRRAADNDLTQRLDAVIDVEAGLREVLNRGKEPQ